MVEGPLRKMLAGMDDRVHYALTVGQAHLPIDDRVGGRLTIRATGLMTCVACGRSVKKFFGQGFCFPCFRDAPEAAECIVRPELCRAHLGEGRDPEWERRHHDQEHVVYLAHTGGIKVGVTRSTQVPVRWIDQGAVAAVIIARTPYRQLAGLIEVELKKRFADKTNWRAMLRPVEPDMDALLHARSEAMTALAHELGAYALSGEETVSIHYPVDHFPPKVASVSLEKGPAIEGTLAAIKGQYLVWADGRVLNVRNHAGYHVEVE
ncbi:MAG: DUF2797 domain-containing protein [Flavobacteriales bacterium]|nr:DUF2797 domain-containing protein [Flavobacteriales bacterium]MCB9165937.1 DUF2797 domain-containing protein [Flavobacteriales bacterium]